MKFNINYSYIISLYKGIFEYSNTNDFRKRKKYDKSSENDVIILYF